MYNPSRNPQVRYSLLQLTGSLFYYLQSAPLEDITVTEICRRAGLTRRTFYRNCEEKKDLVLYACDWLVEQLIAGVDYSSSDAWALYRNFFAYWYEHRVFLGCVYRRGLFDLFADRFIFLCNRRQPFPLQEEALGNRPDSEGVRRFNNSFLLGGLTRMLYAWAEEDFRTSVEDLIRSILFLLPREYQREGNAD